VVAIDGTKMSANASMNANRDFGQIAREILEEAAEIDRREDELYGRERGDELPEHLRTREGRRKALREANERLERERGQAAEPAEDDGDQVAVDLDPQRFVTRPQGRRVWVREGRRALDAKREREARPIAHDRTDRLFEACRRLEEELAFEHASHQAYEGWRVRGIAANGSRRMAPGTSSPMSRRWREGLINTTDHDSRVVRTHGRPPLQGYNAQMAVNDQHVVLAAEVTTESPDFGHLEPMVRATQRELRTVDLGDPDVVVAVAGYWHQRQMQHIVSDGMTVLVPPDAGLRTDARPAMDRRALRLHAPRPRQSRRPRALPPAPDHHRARLRPDQVQPRHQRFQRRGRTACRSEWRFIAATHNLVKLHNHHLAAATADRPPGALAARHRSHPGAGRRTPARTPNTRRDGLPDSLDDEQHSGWRRGTPARRMPPCMGGVTPPASSGELCSQAGMREPAGGDQAPGGACSSSTAGATA
jgi:hypothetical protein